MNTSTSAQTAWLAAMCTEAALVAVERAIEEAGTIDEYSADRLRLALRSNLEPAVGEVLEKMSVPEIALQPIVHLEGRTVIGYEALARFGGGNDTATAFRRAAERGLQVEVEVAALRAALARLPDLPPTVFLGVNLSAEALLDQRVTELLTGADMSRLVVEMTQQAELGDVARIKQCFRALQAEGAVFCLDGAGVGFLTAARIVELEPEMVKISRSIISGCLEDPAKQSIIREMVSVARRIGALSVAIGVEVVEERDLLLGFGLDAVQGHLFGTPSIDVRDAILPAPTVQPVPAG
ncbi:MAG: EAL domain-containing protein [Ilumatobacter sp.]|uniref:EAL domain-containing protein n=1 Tax=Ilumatobacter sp. TaxID=1967498 RepID=UPI003C73940E